MSVQQHTMSIKCTIKNTSKDPCSTYVLRPLQQPAVSLEWIIKEFQLPQVQSNKFCCKGSNVSTSSNSVYQVYHQICSNLQRSLYCMSRQQPTVLIKCTMKNAKFACCLRSRNYFKVKGKLSIYKPLTKNSVRRQ